MYQTKKVLFLAFIFMVVGLISIALSHDFEKTKHNFVSQDNYIDYIRPWIEDLALDPSLDNIIDIKSDFLNFKGSDQSMGQAHITLFMAFESWEKYLMTGNYNNKDKSLSHFSKAADMLPELSDEIEELKNILNNQNV